MRCREVERILESGAEETAAVREHLEACPACAARARDWTHLKAGFASLGADPGPEPSWGFSERVMRRLADASAQGQRLEEFLERAGKRVVYATLLVTLMTLLGLVLPTSGPLRGPSHPTVLFAQPETTADNQEPILGVGSMETEQPGTASPTTRGSAGVDSRK